MSNLTRSVFCTILSEHNNKESALSLCPPEVGLLLYKKFFVDIPSRELVLGLADMVRLVDYSTEPPTPILHSFTGGVYTRQLICEKGYLIEGVIHKKEYLVTLLKGKVWGVNEFGSFEYSAPAQFTFPAGTKNIVYVLEDMVWQDYHSCDSTTIPEAEAEIFAYSYEELDQYTNCISGGKELCQVG